MGTSAYRQQILHQASASLLSHQVVDIPGIAPRLLGLGLPDVWYSARPVRRLNGMVDGPLRLCTTRSRGHSAVLANVLVAAGDVGRVVGRNLDRSALVRPLAVIIAAADFITHRGSLIPAIVRLSTVC